MSYTDAFKHGVEATLREAQGTLSACRKRADNMALNYKRATVSVDEYGKAVGEVLGRQAMLDRMKVIAEDFDVALDARMDYSTPRTKGADDQTQA